ncbi:MAG: NADPH-dependent glutamate synthase [Elusimicrobia bacterium]|nr:NADPH-dependent glutamate synthase [Elusimicrobiota bacterium]
MTRNKMPEAPAAERKNNFTEVALGYTEQQAIMEAARCIRCKKPKCIEGCPVGIDISKFIKEIAEKNFSGAIKTLKEKNNLPGVCGRVCPQETQCEIKCVLGKKGGLSVAIGCLERFAADWEISNAGGEDCPKTETDGKHPPDEKTVADGKKKVAVVGSGPAGLTCAADLAKAGVSVTIFEALHEPGGVLRYGIPSFRLPKNIIEREIQYVKSLGVEIICNAIIGKLRTLDDLFKMGYSSIFIGTGAGLPVFPGAPGVNLCRIYSANEFLTRINLMGGNDPGKYDTPINTGKNVAVIGGGNTAMDAARSALRLGCDVTILYRRTEKEMPARLAEIRHAKEEGIKFTFLTQPVEFTGDKNGYVTGVKCLKCTLGEKDSSGRQSPVPVRGSEFVLPADTVIIAMGLKPNPVIQRVTAGLETAGDGSIRVNPDTMETSIKKVFAGGDIVGGEGTVIEAMGMGKRAARSIVSYFFSASA